MKTSNPFANRKARDAKDLGRKGVGDTPGYARILIVCEGQKTEPYYFEAFKSDYRDQLKAIEIRSAPTAPISNVEMAEKLYREDLSSVAGDKSLAYAAVYCVFDRDAHPSFAKANAKIAALKAGKSKLPIHGAVSYPCFEFWLILHFQFSRSPFAKTGNKSIGDIAKKELTKYPGFKSYIEREPNAYALTKEKLREGIKHSKRALKAALDVGELNPSTRIHELVECLLEVVHKSLVAERKKQKMPRPPIDPLREKINAIESILSKTKTT